MHVLPSILDLDEHFSTITNVTVFNELLVDKSTDEVIDILCDISSDRSDTVASCECGELNGNYYEGAKCKFCGTICQRSLFEAIRNDTWLEIPGVIKAVLNPQVYLIISKWFGTINKVNILQSMLDMSLPREPIFGTPFFSGMGFNWFYDNFDTVIGYFVANHPTRAKRANVKMMVEFIRVTGKALWCTKLPILSKVLQPITRASDSIRYADSDSKALMKAIFTLRSVLLSDRMMKFQPDHIERNFFKIYIEFISYVTNIQTTKLPPKPGVFRKHVFGARFHCSGRSVIVPIIAPHNSDEIYLPWKLGLMMYKYHIISILVNRNNLTVFAAYDKVMSAMNIYDHEIDVIMQGLIKDCPYPGLPILVNRNPSLKIAAVQLLFVTKIKPGLTTNPFPVVLEEVFPDLNEVNLMDQDISVNNNVVQETPESIVRMIEDGTIEISPLVIKGPNIDLTSFRLLY